MYVVMKPFLFVGIVLGHVFMARSAEPFDAKAHEALTLRAARSSNMDNFLKTVLGFEFANGINEGLLGNPVERHIQNGAVKEDTPFWRVVNHFHNPKLSWDQAGLRPPGSPSPIGQSSIVWSQNINQGYGGKASWHQAREAYFNALTATDPFVRKVRWAETFRFLGHALHHVQDAASPSHTRNDSHAPGNSDALHSFSERSEILALIDSISAMPLGASFLSNQPSPDSRYPIPIARLLDSTAGDIGASALGTGSGIGIAEYSNANFFSDDTIFPETFPYPGLSNLQMAVPEHDPQTEKKKRYLIFKPGFGDGTNYRLAQASSLRNITGTNVPTDIGLDYKVLTDYAFKLFPRAISYSAGLIDYFFRAEFFAATAIVSFASQDFAYAKAFILQNTSSETMTGSFYVLAKYADQQQQSSVAQWEGISLNPGDWVLLCLSGVENTSEACVFPSQESQSSVEASQCEPFVPPPVRMKQFTIVFKGDLGKEIGTGVGVATYEYCDTPPV
jgi:hypothetical protein